MFYLQANGYAEAANKIIKNNLKSKLDIHKGTWVDKLFNIFWAYQTTLGTSTE